MNKTVVVRCSTNFLLCSDLPILLLLQVILKCNVNDSSFVISQVYNMVLITICTYYAVLTRKVTMNWILAFASLKHGISIRGGVTLEFVRNSFDSIQNFAIRLIRKSKKYSKNSVKINSKFVRFDSTSTIGWSQIFQMLDSIRICSFRFEN